MKMNLKKKKKKKNELWVHRGVNVIFLVEGS